jgi:hypothetical protein
LMIVNLFVKSIISMSKLLIICILS